LAIDDRALGLLIEESDDVHSDAMRTTRRAVAEITEYGPPPRPSVDDPAEARQREADRWRQLRRGLTGIGAVGGFGAGAAVLNLLGAKAAFGQSNSDVSAAQTAASIENLAIKVYNTAAGLPFMKNIPDPAGSTVVAFVTKTVQQHTDHAAAFNGLATALGGKTQTGVDMTVYNAVVVPMLPKLKAPLDVVNFAAELELAAAETYSVETAAVSDIKLRGTFASVMGVENQHRAILLAVAALLAGGAPQLIKLGPPAAQLPAAAGSVGFPDSFLKTDQARPATEGAVQ
jgi:rubrerythrin